MNGESAGFDMNRITFLGTGTSVGVPMLGCNCEVCRSADPRDTRLRCSSLLEIDGLRILIDCGPDFRAQALRHDITSVDAVLLTHEHYDHVGGLDDVRPLGNTHLYGETRVLDAVRRVMPYCFGENKYPGSPTITLHEALPGEAFRIGAENLALEVMPLRVMHNKLPILGYRLEDCAYITDASQLPEDTTDALCGVKTLIINALQIPSHPAHFSLAESIEVARKIGAKQTYFIHFSHKIGLHALTDAALPEGMHLAYDNLTVEI